MGKSRRLWNFDSQFHVTSLSGSKQSDRSHIAKDTQGTGTATYSYLHLSGLDFELLSQRLLDWVKQSSYTVAATTNLKLFCVALKPIKASSKQTDGKKTEKEGLPQSKANLG